MLTDALKLVVEKKDLTAEQARAAMSEIMDGEAAPTLIAAFITALRMKGETYEEIAAFAAVMRERVVKVTQKGKGSLLDTCGTGGDSSGTFNISTAAAFVAAGAGVPVAKHGNRSVSSKCGSADVLKELGVNVEASPEVVTSCLNEIGICFIFAPLFHPAMKYAIGPRREIGIRTVFNLLGPLTNPAGADCQLIGVYDPELTTTVAETLRELGSRKAYVVHGHGGIDEIALSGKTVVAELKDGLVRNYEIFPEDFAVEVRPAKEIKGGDATLNARIVRAVLDGIESPYMDVVCLNAGAAISAFYDKMTIKNGVAKAYESVRTGAAARKLEKLIELSNA